MSKTTKILTASLLDAAAVFLGAYGIIFSIVTAYDIKLNASALQWMLIFSSLCFSLLFSIEKYKKTAYTAVSAVCALLFLKNIEDIANGFLKFLHIITSKLHLFTPSVPVTKDVNISVVGQIEANTAFFALFSVVLILLLTLAIIKARSVWLASIISVCCFSLSILFIKNVPDMLPVCAFLVFLLSAVLTTYIRKSSSKRASYMLSLFLPLTLVFVITVNAIFPESTYNRTSIADTMYRFFAERLPITIKRGGTSKTPDPSVSGDDVSTISGDTSEGNSNINKSYQKINLNSAVPSKTGETILQVKSGRKGTILLRGFSLGNYTGTSWEQFDEAMQQKLYLYQVIDRSITGGDEIYVTPLSLPAFYAMLKGDTERYSVQVAETAEGGEIVYTPYYPVFSNFRDLSFDSEAYVLYKNNIVPTGNKNEKATYTLDAYAFGDIMDIIGNESEISRVLSILPPDYSRLIQGSEAKYRAAVYQTYTRIDGDTLAFLKEYTYDEHFEQITDLKELVHAVSRFVKNSAEYNINTPQTPAGEDYLRYFLTKSRQGYCMHFATEATLIFRMLGIPARYVTGFSVNVASDQVGEWVHVTDRNAHAWTEIYIDSLGWIPVDVTPTAYQNHSDTSGDGASRQTSVPPISSSSDSSSESSVTSSAPDPESSAAFSEETSQPAVPVEDSFELPGWVYIVVIVLLALLAVLFRRKYLAEQRRKLFAQKNTNKAVVCAWNYIEKLKAFGVNPDKSIYSIAQKAVFSRHTLTEAERKTVVDFAKEKAEELDKNLGFLKRLIFRYIKGLY